MATHLILESQKAWNLTACGQKTNKATIKVVNEADATCKSCLKKLTKSKNKNE